MKSKIIKILENNKGKYFHEFVVGKVFFVLFFVFFNTPEALTIKENSDIINIKNFNSSKNIIERVNIQVS